MLGRRIGELRRRAGMSQSELAGRLQVSPSAVGMYEQGRREPSADTLVAMAQVFGVSVDYLLTGEEPDQGPGLDQGVLDRIAAADRRLDSRRPRPFSRQELAVLLAALLME